MTYTEAIAINTDIVDQSKYTMRDKGDREILDGKYERWVKLPDGTIGIVSRIQQYTGNILVHIPIASKCTVKYLYVLRIILPDMWDKCELI